MVVETGPEVMDQKDGDEVFHASDVTRPGMNAEFHAVDERIIGGRPASLGLPEAAGVPPTAITAWEMLFDSFRLTEGAGKAQSL